MRQLFYIVVSMRPWQWTKNLVVFAALIFSRNLTNDDLVWKSVEAFAIFCLLSGMIYLVNDTVDVEKDKMHDVKRNRPLPSGKLKVPVAWGVAVLGFAGGMYAAYAMGVGFFVVSISFVVLNLFYSFVLKRVALLDVMSIAVGFVLRAISGVEALRVIEPSVQISPWLLICTLLLSLFLGFCKRRHELVTMDQAVNHRESLLGYSPALLDQLVGITAAGAIIAYTIYTIWPDTVQKFGTTALVYTVPLVLLGVFRYLYLVYNEQKGGSPSDLLLREKFLLIDVIVWIVLVIAILHGI